MSMPIDWTAIREASPPPKRTRRADATRQRLIHAAAELFADRGLDGVQPAEILVRAGQRNVSAIQYHFGSWEGLIVAILQPREDIRGPIERERSTMLAAMDAREGATTLRDAVEALVRPSAAALATHDGRCFIRVAAQVVRALPLEDRVAPAPPSDRAALERIAARLEGIPAPLQRERVGVAMTLLVELLANRAREIEEGTQPHLGAREFEDNVIAMLEALLLAPVPTTAADAG
jgi:TetR/AcrR family transcriptional regulator, regulator of cefoperazone and chloramphenicol sensitivity